jgi:hypothetical protein
MTDLGIVGEEVNAKKFQVYVGANDISGAITAGTEEWKLLQNARVLISHPVFREPTTSGGVKTFTGAPDNSISGSLIFSRDSWTATTFGLEDLAGASSTTGEVPLKVWTVKFTDVDGASTNTTLSFNNCKLSVVDISKSVEGGVKVDITIVCPDEPESS